MVYHDLEITIDSTDGPRIECIRLHRVEPSSEQDTSEFSPSTPE
jgi:hypothetical protein